MRPVIARYVPSLLRISALGALLVPLASCTATTAGQSSSFVMIQALRAASGAEPGTFGGTLASDVLTKASIYADPAQVVFSLALKDQTGLEPTANNFVTFNRYRVTYIRSDGRNTPGVDVPYAFDGGLTVTVTDQPVTAAFELVRIQSKLENPLLPLVGMGGALAISTIAEVTFYGADQTGREVSATGRISVTFADWGDPE